MRKLVLIATILASATMMGVPAHAASRAVMPGHDALASILAQTGPIETVQYGTYREREAARRRQAARRREFRRRQAARRYYRGY